jgi:hypothetical protein
MRADEDAVLFTCRCSNVVVYGRTTGETASDNAERPDSGLEEIWLKKGAEKEVCSPLYILCLTDGRNTPYM